MASFNGAQSFYVDPSIVEGSHTVDIASVTMYFMYRPQAVNNRTGTAYPGVTVYLTDVVNGAPNFANTMLPLNYARCDWNAVLTSSDASAPSVFTFNSPITVDTGASYAFIFSYDNNEDFLPWFNIKGNDLVGTTTTSTGPSSPYGGGYFNASSIGGNNNVSAAWNPVSGIDLKFQVGVARYAINGTPVADAGLSANQSIYTSNVIISESGNGALIVTHPAPRPENIAFDIASSIKQTYVGAQRVYQNTVNYPGGGVWASVSTNGSNTITANAAYSNGATFNWNTVFGGYSGPTFLAINYGTSVDLRQVTGILSNTVITVDEPTTSSNGSAGFMLTPVASIDSFNTSTIDGGTTSLVFLRDSSANSSVRFTGHSVDLGNVAISVGGTGYNNSDVLYVQGYQNVNNVITGNYPAKANLVTNSTGGVVSVNWSNVGVGFTNASAVFLAVANSSSANNTANTSNGSSLALALGFGSVVMTEFSNNVFRNSRPINLDIHTLLPVVNAASSIQTTTYTSLSTIYYLATNPNTANGFATFVGPAQNFTFTPNVMTYLNAVTNIPVVVSRSLEFSTLYANGAPNDQVNATLPYSNNYYVQLTVTSNNDYVAVGPFYSPLLDFGRYIINDSYANENTDSGNAYARHITTVFNMSGPANTSQMAEDVQVYLSAWRPPGTDLQVFARIQNSTDSESFIDEDWTRLQLQTNNFSTSGYVDLGYGFQQQPNTTQTLAGTAATTNNTANVVGSNTNWTFPNNTLLKIYDPLFPNTDFAVVLATNVVNSSFIEVDQVFNTNSVFGIGGFELTGRGGLSVDVLGYGHQAFNNVQNDNIVRYYNDPEHVYDGFNILQVKVVMLSPDPHFIPRIHNIRGIGLSA